MDQSNHATLLFRIWQASLHLALCMGCPCGSFLKTLNWGFILFTILFGLLVRLGFLPIHTVEMVGTQRWPGRRTDQETVPGGWRPVRMTSVWHYGYDHNALEASGATFISQVSARLCQGWHKHLGTSHPQHHFTFIYWTEESHYNIDSAMPNIFFTHENLVLAFPLLVVCTTYVSQSRVSIYPPITSLFSYDSRRHCFM